MGRVGPTKDWPYSLGYQRHASFGSYVITIGFQDYSSVTETEKVYDGKYESGGWWFDKENLVRGGKYTVHSTQKPYIEFLCHPNTLDYFKNACDTDDLVQCVIDTVDNERINLTKKIYYKPGTNIELAR